ncbi:MAG: HAD-IIA family hydrolase [Chloroflexota bacterium]
MEPRPRLVIFDLDGVIYRGGVPVPGAVDLVARLHASGIGVRFATNNSLATRADYVRTLAAMGIASSVDEIVTSNSATILHLQRHAPDVHRILAVGERGLLSELRAAGFEVTPAAELADAASSGAPLEVVFDAVVAGLDRSFDYGRLAAAASAIRGGARFVATNADSRYPTPHGFLPGAGSMVSAIATAGGEAAVVIGKPAPAMLEAIVGAAGLRPTDALMIGDNPDADIVAARRAGIRSVLVLTGVADAGTAARLDGERRPDHVVDGPGAVATLLGLVSG